MKSFYEFKGSWHYIFDTLVGVITPSNIGRFTIWQSKSGNSKNLLIVYELKLHSEWENENGIHQISESEFSLNYKSRMDDHIIHGFNEFDRNRYSALPTILKKILSMF